MLERGEVNLAVWIDLDNEIVFVEVGTYYLRSLPSSTYNFIFSWG